MFQLLLAVIFFVVMLVLVSTGGQRALENRFTTWAGFALLPLIVPLFAVTVRRLHDLGLRGWWLALFFVGGAIPAIDTIAALAYLVVMALPGSRKANRFGPSLR
ncbi:DUF805 domain-containing protein [Sphingomonas radiodurans]|uniref:DUF805 domain-containing protein n=1 Tax=Sphingomonas radiodurans TaxID=2890321 RepID=UPI001E550F34|nr:DUF805 domain-containing protein [Sphingomonas radiodurans]WBH17688.1 DUF805 domain-containing protein [Sphingomonas radiodurans]